LDRAIEARKPQRGSLIHHSDRGVQYASIAYRQILADRDITFSMSRPGNPFDNAKAESFMKTLKATNRPLSSKSRSRKTRLDNPSWQPHCHRDYRVSLEGCSPPLSP
jgi:putative transposase